MTTAIEMLNHKITLSIGVITLVGMGLAFMDTRHASASGLVELTESIVQDRIERMEYKIAENDRRIKRLKRIPEDEMSQFDREDLEDYSLNKERYLRTLERLQAR